MRTVVVHETKIQIYKSRIKFSECAISQKTQILNWCEIGKTRFIFGQNKIFSTYVVIGFGNVLVRSWSTNWAKKTKLRLAKSSGGFLLFSRRPRAKASRLLITLGLGKGSPVARLTLNWFTPSWRDDCLVHYYSFSGRTASQMIVKYKVKYLLLFYYLLTYFFIKKIASVLFLSASMLGSERLLEWSVREKKVNFFQIYWQN